MIRREINIFFTALMFYTRIPCPSNIDHSPEMLNKATRYFPLMGWIVGGLSALVYWSAALILPESVAILLSMASSILATGAFHEDGFADICDGMGGGYTPDQILKIMKDSRIGTYGTIGLIFMLGLKFTLLQSTESEYIPILLLVGHSLSRLAPTLTIFFFKYARADESSKVKPIGKRMAVKELILAMIFGILPVLLLQEIIYTLLIIPVILVHLYLSNNFKKKIGGYTGDCLGAIQQVSEIAVYLTFLLITQFYA